MPEIYNWEKFLNLNSKESKCFFEKWVLTLSMKWTKVELKRESNNNTKINVRVFSWSLKELNLSNLGIPPLYWVSEKTFELWLRVLFTRLQNQNLFPSWYVYIPPEFLEEFDRLDSVYLNKKEEINKNLYDYFNLDKGSLSSISSITKEAWLNFDPKIVLSHYQSFIEKNFRGVLKDSQVDKIKLSIKIRILNIYKIISSLKKAELESNWNLKEFNRNRWIINSKIQDSFNFVNNQLFPSLEFYIKEKSWKLRDLSNSKETVTWVNINYRINDRIREIDEMLDSEIDENWNFNEWFFSTQAIFDKTRDVDAKIFEYKNFNATDIGKINLLTEKDKELEEKINYWYLWFSIFQMIPYLGATWSIPTDILDAFSSEEWSIKLLQTIWLVPEDFKMEKWYLDNIFWFLWLGLSIFWLQSLSKVSKIDKLTKILWKIDIEKLVTALKEISEKMNLDININEIITKLQNLTTKFNLNLLKKEVSSVSDITILKLKSLNEWDYIFINWQKKYIAKVSWNIIITKHILEDWKVVSEKINLKMLKSSWEYNWLSKAEFSILDIEDRMYNLVNIASNINEIKEAILKKWQIWRYSSDYLIDVINQVMNWTLDVTHITRLYWLRDKVALLKNNSFIQRSFLKDLWPYWLDHITKQWQVWNCYFVRALDSVKFHPDWWKLLTEMITIVKPWKEWRVKFEWYYQEIIITLKDIEDLRRSKPHGWVMQTGNIWDLIIERAHARYVNQVIKWRSQWRTVLVNEKWKLPHEGWYSKEVLELFFWDKIDAKYIYKNDFDSFFYNYDHKDFLWLSSKYKTWMTDEKTYDVLDVRWRTVKLHYSHAYSIYNVDRINWVVDVINPHNSWEVIHFKISDLKNYFDRLDYWKFINSISGYKKAA